MFTCPWLGGSGSYLLGATLLLPMLFEVHHTPDAGRLLLQPAGPSLQPWRVYEGAPAQPGKPAVSNMPAMPADRETAARAAVPA